MDSYCWLRNGVEANTTGTGIIGNATLNVYGTVHSAGLIVSETATSNGTVNVFSGGTLNVGEGGWGINVGQAAPGRINLNDTGNMVIDGDGGWHLNLYSGRGHIDIEAGQLKVKGDHRTELQSCANNGWISGYGTAGNVVVAYDAGLNQTIVTADVVPPGLEELPGDINGDGYVNIEDFAAFAEDWLKCTATSDPNCS